MDTREYSLPEQNNDYQTSPTTKKKWLLVAEQLHDPNDWDRFLACHTVSSERCSVDSMVKQKAAGKFKINLSKDLLKRGTSVFEYSWETDQDDILMHALDVAESIGVDLLLDSEAQVASTPLKVA